MSACNYCRSLYYDRKNLLWSIELLLAKGVLTEVEYIPEETTLWLNKHHLGYLAGYFTPQPGRAIWCAATLIGNQTVISGLFANSVDCLQTTDQWNPIEVTEPPCFHPGQLWHLRNTTDPDTIIKQLAGLEQVDQFERINFHLESQRQVVQLLKATSAQDQAQLVKRARLDN